MWILLALLSVAAAYDSGWGVIYHSHMATAIECLPLEHSGLLLHWFAHLNDTAQRELVQAEAVDSVARMMHGRKPICRALREALHKALQRMYYDSAQEQNRHRKQGWPETVKHMEKLRHSQDAMCPDVTDPVKRRAIVACLRQAQDVAMQRLAVEHIGE